MPNWAPVISALDTTVRRVSTNSAGEQAAYSSFEIAFSPDGTHIAFSSQGYNLVAGDNNNTFDVFIKNLQTGVVTRVSTDAAGGETGGGTTPVFLPGGDKIAFLSAASNLVPGDTNGLLDIFVKNLATGAITRASTYTDGKQFTVNDYYSTTGMSAPDFSPDGTKMAFAFHDGGGVTVYIKDLNTGTLTVAVPISFAEGAHIPGAEFSPDGTKLLYRQYAPGESIPGLYIKDLASGAVTLVSTNAAGDPANSPSEGARFSPDGTRIVFTSGADNLVPGQTGGLFIKDLITGAVTLVSVNGYAAAFSPDGTKVAFTGNLDDPVTGATNPFADIYLKDLLTGEIVRISVRNDGYEGPVNSGMAVFSPDGASVGFYGDELVLPDTNGSYDVYLATLAGAVPYVEGGPAAQIVPVARVFDQGNNHFPGGSLSVAITAGSVPGDQLSLAPSSAPGQRIAISGDQILVNDIVVGTLASTSPSLVISLNANATDRIVEWLIQAVRISSTSDDPTAAIRTITFTLVDGGGTADGGQDTGSFSRKVVFVPVDDGQQIFGTPGDDVLNGGSGNDFIDGGNGDDELFGQLGNDELAGGGGNDTLDGGQGNDLLDGGAGIDTMAGGFHNDVYVVDNAGDVVTELAGGGTDSVSTLVDYQLAAGSHVERLTSISWALTTPLRLTGNEFVNLLEGNAGNNILDGRGGADRLVGFGGNDKYVVDTAGDVVVEASGGGTDSISALVDYTLALDSHVERLNAISAALTTPLKLTGNNFVNQIEGNAGNNILDGRGGADALIGFGGNDKYVVDNAGDVVTELAGGGTDSISAAVDYTLGVSSHVERLNAISFALTTPLKLTGNNFVNLVEGNAGNNTLDGRGGADALVGLGGDDKYIVDNAGDVVTELAGGGNDSVSTVVDYQLTAGSHVERLTSISWALTTPLKLTGNELANRIEGNAGANQLDGKGGADTLAAFGGADTFAFTSALGGGNIDVIEGFVSGTDKIALDDAIFAAIGAVLDAAEFRLGTGAADADDRIVYNSATGQLFYDTDGVGGAVQVQFATLSGAPLIAAGDFLMI